MRKQRPTRTGTRKLKGFSRQEASKRSKKGWQTRKLHGKWDGILGASRPRAAGRKYTPRQLHHDDGSSSSHHEDVPYHIPGSGGDSGEHKERTLSREEASVAGSPGVHIERMSWKERVAWEAEEFSHGRPMSAEFEKAFPELSAEDQSGFFARVRRAEEREKRAAQEGKDPMKESDIRTESAAELRRYIATDPNRPGVLVTRAWEDPDALSSRRDFNADHEEVLPHEVLVNRIRGNLNQTFTREDPRAAQPGRRKENVRLITPVEHRAFVALVEKSHFGKTEYERKQAAIKAEKLAGQLSQKAQERYDKLQGEALDQALESKLRKDQGILDRPPDKPAQARDTPTSKKAEKFYYSPKGPGSGKPKITKLEVIQGDMPRRLGPRAEDLYGLSGHETGYDTRGNKLSRSQRLKNHWAFEKGQAKNKVKSFRTGDYTGGWSKRGRFEDPATAAFRLSPNKTWEYNLKKKDNPLGKEHKVLNYWDTKTKINKKDILIEGQGVRFEKAVNFAVGDRESKIPERLKDHQEAEIFIPLKGARRASKDIKPRATSENYTIYQVRDVNGRWMDASYADYQLARTNAPARDSSGEYVTRPGFKTKKIGKTTKATFLDPSELKRTGRDELSFKIPGFKVGSKEFGERVLDIDTGQIAGGKVGDAAFAYEVAKGERELRALSEERAWKRAHERGTVKEKGTLKDIAAAGGFAAFYGTRKNVRKGWAPDFANRKLDTLAKKNKWFNNNMENARFDIDEAFVRGGLVPRIANAKFKVKHPFSSPEGVTMGVEWGGIADRTGQYSRWIPGSKDRIESRKLKVEIARIHRLKNTEAFLDKNAYANGPFGRIARHRSEPMARWQDWKDFHSEDGVIANAIEKSKEGIESHPEGSKANKAAWELHRLASQAQKDHELKTNAMRFRKPGVWTPGTTMPEHMSLVPVGAKKNGRLRSIGTPSKNLMIGGGIAASAVGAHYLYYRHKQKQLLPEDRESYLSFITPGPIELPTVHTRATGHARIPHNNFTDEFNLGGKRVPVQFGVSPGRKNVWKGSPKDRGYNPKAKLTGGIRGSGKGTHGGSLAESLFFDQAASGNKARSKVPEGGQILFRGKKLPIRGKIGKKEKVILSPTNPNRLTQADRENLVWAFHNDREGWRQMKEFYSGDERMQRLMANTPEVQRIVRQKGSAEGFKLAAKDVKIAKSYIESVPVDTWKLGEDTVTPLQFQKGWQRSVRVRHDPSKNDAIFFATARQHGWEDDILPHTPTSYARASRNNPNPFDTRKITKDEYKVHPRREKPDEYPEEFVTTRIDVYKTKPRSRQAPQKKSKRRINPEMLPESDIKGKKR